MMIILVRHGEATHHTEHLTGGWTDSVLTEQGHRQLQLLALRLAKDFSGHHKQVPTIITSDLRRAEESAEIIANALGGKVSSMEFLREKNNGLAAGLTEEAARALYDAPATLKELDHANYPGGETRRQFFYRVQSGLRVLGDLTKEDLIIVAHKGTIQNIIFDWSGFDIEAINAHNFSVDILPASITILGINKWQEHAIFLLNDTAHLHAQGGVGVFGFKYAGKHH